MANPQQPFEKFDLFWASYPRRVAKGDARNAFTKLRVDDALLDKMLTALEWQKNSPDWLRDDGQWIPYPATWLRAERWEDEPMSRPVTRRDSDWFDECKRLHGGACGLDRWQHGRLMAASKAS